MMCSESETLLHGLLDGELDTARVRTLHAHLDACACCATQLRLYRRMRQRLAAARLDFAAPTPLRQRLEEILPPPQPRSISRRAMLKGFVMGSAFSAAMAATLVVAVVGRDPDRRIFGDIVTAHVRSLQGDHLTDVRANDQQAVRPWFNGKVDVAPPVVDLAAQGFTLIGGRLDYVDGKAVASIVYRHRAHVINLFVMHATAAEPRGAEAATMQGFNLRCWGKQGMEFFAVSDIAAGELQEFSSRYEMALDPNSDI
jgi:anti-sigma factor RsiW